jgi:DNA polymerase-3 subunit beta
MEFSLNCSTVIPVLNQIIKTCDKTASNTNSMILFKEYDGGIYITSTNNRIAEQTILLPIDKLVSEVNESFFVSGQQIVEFFRAFPDEEAECKYDGSKLLIKGGYRDIKFEFPTTTSDGYIPFHCVSESNPIECDAQSLSNSFVLTAFSSATDDDLGILTGVNVTLMGDKLITQSSDNTRISINEIDIEDVGVDPFTFLIPKEVADILSSSLNDVVSVNIEKCKNHIKFCWDDVIFVSRTVSDPENDFPDLFQYIDGNKTSEIKISRVELLKALRLAALLAKDSCVILNSSDKGLKISTKETDKGSSSNVVDAEFIDGKAETNIPFKNLLKGIEVIGSPWLVMEFREMSFTDLPGICLVDDSYRHFIFPAA